MTLSKQAASLAVLHVTDVLQPLIILPYAGRVLGPMSFGRYAYALAIGQLAAVVVAYGFHWTAQRRVASLRYEPAAIASLVAQVMATKAVLFIAVCLVGLVLAGDVLALSRPTFLCAMLSAAGGIIFPAWLFVGLERAWQAAVAVVVARVLALVCFVAMVASPDQVALAVAIQSAVPVVSGVICLPFILPFGFGGFRSVTLSTIGMQLRNGWRGCLFIAVETALVTLPVALVQHFAGYVAAGQYSVAEKFLLASRVFFKLLMDTFIPRVSYYAHVDPAAGVRLIRRSLFTVAGGAAMSIGMFFIAPYIILILFGDKFSGATPIVRAMAIIPFLMNINTFTSNVFMFSYGYENEWAALNAAGLLVFLVAAYSLSFVMAEQAIVYAMVAKEVVVLVVSAGFFLIGGAAVLRTAAACDAGRVRAHPPASQSAPLEHEADRFQS
ncbi:oligosaccharide flippase family protein [Mesorhizobium sp. M1182]|uniref:oligosaccharide flippase family protein n=1 Tax=unclassified Mesorhizobium TaxID=325217 RepID=UPI003338C99F